MADITFNEFTRDFHAAANYEVTSNQDMGRPFTIGHDHENCRDPGFTYGGDMGGDVVHETMPDEIEVPPATRYHD